MKTLYLIPARGGSKGIPHKNIRPLCGLPLIGYSINVAREFADDCDICLSTDDPEIAETARKMGLDVPFMRPDSLATDKSGSYEVMLHALDFYHNRGVDYDRLVLLQPTSPMRTADDVRRALELYTPDIDMVVTVKEAESNPYYNCFEEGDDGFLQISKGDGTFTRRRMPRKRGNTTARSTSSTPQASDRCLSASSNAAECVRWMPADQSTSTLRSTGSSPNI